MKILVLSDSHSHDAFMRRCIDALKPDAVIHLGDHYSDCLDLRFEYREIPFYQVPGNCDGYRLNPDQQWIRVEEIGGVRFYMTHGHLHNVKSHLYALLRDAREAKADVALYGHTHRPDCFQEEDGLWVLNPGTASFLASAGVVEIDDGKVSAVYLLTVKDL